MLGLILATAMNARVAVVTVTMGYRHESIPVAEATIATIAERTGWFVPQFFRTEEDLQHFDATQFDVVMFVNTTGELPLRDRAALLQWVRDGGTFVGVHSASDTFHEWSDYLDMLGGEFDSHPDQMAAQLRVDDPTHPSTAALASPVTIFEEYYRFKRFDASRVHILLSLNGDEVMPMSWWRTEGRGRVFYTALGHRDDVWQSDWFRQHLTGALAWALAPQAAPRRRAVRR
jgi:type 1 glutamine amidotransferase